MAYSPTYSGTTWTVTELLDEIKDEAAIPSSSRFTDAKILAFTDQAIRSAMTEPIVANMGMSGRMLDYDDILVSDGFRSGGEYLVPNAAASGNISHIEYYTQSTATPYKLDMTTVAEWLKIRAGNSENEGSPTHWFFRDGRIHVTPVPENAQSTARMRIWFPRAHPKLVVTTNNVGTVSSVDQGANTITLAATHPSGWPAAPYAVDLYSAYSPHYPLFTRLVVSSDSGADLTYTAPLDGETDLSGASSATYVALAGQSDCVQLPDVMRKGLTARAASYILRTIGDEARANSLWGVSKEELGSVRNQMHPRQKGGAPHLVNRNGVLRSTSRRRKWGGW